MKGAGMNRSRIKRSRVLALVAAIALIGAACGGSDDGGAEGASPGLTVFSGREEEFVGPLFEAFEADTGIKLDVRYGDSAELAATLLEEGEASPADAFLSQDAGSLGAVAEAGLFTSLPDDLIDRIDPRFV